MAKKSEPTTDDAAKAAADLMNDLQQMGLQSMTWMGSDWVERMSDLGAEMLSFMAERVKKDVELQHKLLHCRDLKELQEVQAEFIQTAIDRYTEETGRMVEMSAKLFAPSAKDKG